MSEHDIWYLEVEATVKGENRGFSRQIRCRPLRNGETITKTVNDIGSEYVGAVLADSDVLPPMWAGDFPYRMASYTLRRNGVMVLESFARRPIKPEVLR